MSTHNPPYCQARRLQAELSGQGALQFWPRSSRKIRVLFSWWWSHVNKGESWAWLRVKIWEPDLGAWEESSVVLNQLPELSFLWDYWQAWLVQATLISSSKLTGRYGSYYDEIGLRSRRRGFPRPHQNSNCGAGVETEGLPIPEQRGQKRVMPYPLMSVLEDQGMAVSALPNFFIWRLFVIIELLSRVWHFCDTMDCSPPGPSVHEVFQGRILKWVAISSSRESSRPRDQIYVSCGSCTTGRAIEPPGKPCIRRKEGQIFVGKCSHQSWKVRDRCPLGTAVDTLQLAPRPPVLPDRVWPTPFSVKKLRHSSV